MMGSASLMNIGTLNTILESVMSAYAKKAFNGFTTLTANPDKTQFVVTSVGSTRSGRVTSTALFARIVGETIIIESDNTNKPLLDALMDAGVPRTQIILPYAGEAYMAAEAARDAALEAWAALAE
jgi:uncharacterized SAM-binding protein YcdF (DUF218 family)